MTLRFRRDLSGRIARAMFIGGLFNFASCAGAMVYWGPFK